MVGPEYSADTQGARIVLSENYNIVIGDTSGRVINNFPRCITIENIEIIGNGTQYPVSVYGVVRGNFRHIYIQTTASNAPGGFYITKNVACVYEDCFVQSVNHTNSIRFMAYHCTDQLNPI